MDVGKKKSGIYKLKPKKMKIKILFSVFLFVGCVLAVFLVYAYVSIHHYIQNVDTLSSNSSMFMNMFTCAIIICIFVIIISIFSEHDSSEVVITIKTIIIMALLFCAGALFVFVIIIAFIKWAIVIGIISLFLASAVSAFIYDWIDFDCTEMEKKCIYLLFTFEFIVISVYCGILVPNLNTLFILY